VHAQEDDARGLSNRGIAHFAKGEFEPALHDFQASYALNPLPDLLFDMAQAYRKLGNCELALRNYTEYLRAAPNGRMHDKAKTQVAALQECHSAAPPPPAAPATIEEKPAAPPPQTPAPIAESSAPEPVNPAPVPQQPTLVEVHEPAQPIGPPVMSKPVERPVSLFKRRWFWGVVAASAVVVAGSVTLGVLFGGSDRYPAASYTLPGN
jgi:hypothetical protein